MTRRLDSLGRLIRERSDDPPAVDVEQVLERANPRARRPRWVWPALGALATCALVALVAWGWRREPRAPEVAEVVDVVGHEGESGFFEAKADSPPLRFTDGSRVTLAVGARLRVAERSPRGVHVTLEEGRVEVEVIHRPNTAWVVQAGDVEIHVRGTRFSVQFDPKADDVEVAMEDGVVEVRAGQLPVTLRAGQRMHFEAGRRRLVVEDRPGDGGTPSPPPEPADPGKSGSGGHDRDAGTQPTKRGHLARPAPSAPAAAAWPEVAWSERLARGETYEIVAEADTRPWAQVVELSNTTELFALAEALRLERRFDDARRAHEAVVARAPASPEAATAGFQLGRLAEAQNQPALARTWYERAVDQPVAFELRAEALGRLMVLLESQHDGPSARRRALQYLELAPTGGWSTIARRLATGDP